MTTADRPATAPTDRSIPPVKITVASPKATNPNGRKFSVNARKLPNPS